MDCLKKVIGMGEPLNYEERKLLLRALFNKPMSLTETWESLKNISEDNILVKNLMETVWQENIAHCDSSIKFSMIESKASERAEVKRKTHLLTTSTQNSKKY